MAQRSRYSIDLSEFDEDIRQIAQDEGRSLSNTIKKLIREAIAERKAKQAFLDSKELIG